MVELIKTSCQAKAGAQKLFFHLNITECSSKLKTNWNTFIRIFIRNTPILALKISKRGGRVLSDAVSCLWFELPICLFGHTRDTSII